MMRNYYGVPKARLSTRIMYWIDRKGETVACWAGCIGITAGLWMLAAMWFAGAL